MAINRRTGLLTGGIGNRPGACRDCPCCGSNDNKSSNRQGCSCVGFFIALALLAIAFAPAPANGHTVLLSRGTVVVHPDRIAATIEVCVEDFLHDRLLTIENGSVATSNIITAADRYGPLLLDRIVLRDVDGRPIRGAIERIQFTPPGQPRIELLSLRRLTITYELEFDTTGTVRFLTFQQRPVESGDAAPSQIVLSVRRASDDAGRMIVLPSAGNAETIDLDQAPRISATTGTPSMTVSPPPIAPTGPDRFKEIEAFVRQDSRGVFVDAYIPLMQLEKFTSIARRNADFIDPPEIEAVVAHLLNYFSSSPPVVFLMSHDDDAMPPKIEWIALLSATDERIDDASTPQKRLSAWSARVAVRLRCPDAEPHAIEWLLLNQAVMNATIYTNVGGRGSAGEPVFPGDSRVTLK